MADLEDYGSRAQTRTEHFKRACEHLGFRPLKEAGSQLIFNWLVERAQEHDETKVLFETILEKLKGEKLVRPGVTTLEKLVMSARERAQEQTYEKPKPALHRATGYL